MCTPRQISNRPSKELPTARGDLRVVAGVGFEPRLRPAGDDPAERDYEPDERSGRVSRLRPVVLKKPMPPFCRFN